MCSKQPPDWLNVYPWNVEVSTERGNLELCWPWGPFWATWRVLPPATGAFPCLAGVMCGDCGLRRQQVRVWRLRGTVSAGSRISPSPLPARRGLPHRPHPPQAAWPPTDGLRPSIVNDGTVQGERYRSARGEILRSLRDQQQRRRSASARPSIKNESPGSKDDQTPS